MRRERTRFSIFTRLPNTGKCPARQFTQAPALIAPSLLGALLTLAPSQLFVVHYATTWPWGLSPLQDQQLGGIIMWVPSEIIGR